jgi:hypothetical protein
MSMDKPPAELCSRTLRGCLGVPERLWADLAAVSRTYGNSRFDLLSRLIGSEESGALRRAAASARFFTPSLLRMGGVRPLTVSMKRHHAAANLPISRGAVDLALFAMVTVSLLPTVPAAAQTADLSAEIKATAEPTPAPLRAERATTWDCDIDQVLSGQALGGPTRPRRYDRQGPWPIR